MKPLKYEVWVKYKGRWKLIAKVRSEMDARLIANDRAKDGDQTAKVQVGSELRYMVEGV